MCQYSAVDGFVQPWHTVHYGARAVGGVGLIILEATAVTEEGRISPQDLGIWDDRHVEGLQSLVSFMKSQGVVAGIQLAHAGRKASITAPWDGDGPLPEGKAWKTLAPSSVAFGHYPAPKEMDQPDMLRVKDAFVKAAKRAKKAGFQVIELHMAHGYLFHEFLSPLSNVRKDQFGGSLLGRMQFPLEVVRAVRSVWPSELPLFVRISATDWKEGGWDLEQSVEFAKALKKEGVDLIDVSSGGLVHDAKIAVGPLFQVPFSAEIRSRAEIATGAVGFITNGQDANKIIEDQKCDLAFVGRQLLRDPYFPATAAKELDVTLERPKQYGRAK
jgi:2,4-dienoyl-CoA reductase-like NADH-dependent reductase (Old Yellow Enzyme family)